ncbi:hypothetical protein Ahy_A02g009275 [Arachis hypogaea]|uniref:Oxo-4-hydroxy-4-carboxy-5-ureidoimidazoline decarboxylase domain-containing protein n=1 Tax=Arachis hypogaea TaxID=3818 RepID=A0A445EGR3_ARAHY|nr:hypothetical protein Ahy_A02g009275 [Arachis hypogaea]
MAMASPFSSLEHAISITRDIWFCKVNVRYWLEEFHECGSMYEEKFGYVFVTCTSRKSSEDILIELKTYIVVCMLIFSVSAEYSGEVVNDSLDRADTDPEDNLNDISSVEIDIPRQFDLNKVRKKDNETLHNQQRQDDVHTTKRASI